MQWYLLFVNFCVISSIILFSWFNDDSVEGTLTKSTSWNLHSQLLERAQNISLSLHPDLLGPFGIDTKNTEVGCDTSEHAGKQPVFNSFDWLQRNDLIFNGIVCYYSEYIYGIRFLGTNVKSDEDGSDIAQGALNFKSFFKKYLKKESSFNVFRGYRKEMKVNASFICLCYIACVSIWFSRKSFIHYVFILMI